MYGINQHEKSSMTNLYRSFYKSYNKCSETFSQQDYDINSLMQQITILLQKQHEFQFQIKIIKKMEQQRIKIQKQLKALRQDSVKDYLSQKLDSLASQEVVNDILHQFLASHDQQFLSNIANSIAGVKLQCKELKAQLKEKQEQYEQFEIKLKNQLKIDYEIKNQTLLNQWTMLQILCSQKVHQQNPRKAIEKLVQHLSQVLQKKQNLQKSIKQLQQKVTFLQEVNQKYLKQHSQKSEKMEQKFETQKKQLRKEINNYETIIQKLRNQLFQGQKREQLMQQKFKGVEIQYKQTHQLLSFLENKVCELKQTNIKLKHEIQLLSKQKQHLQESIEKSKQLTKGLQQENNAFVVKLQNMSRCELDMQNLKEKYTNFQNSSDCEIKTLSEQIINLKKDNLILKAELQHQIVIKMENCSKIQQISNINQKLNEQLSELKKLVAIKQGSFKSYVLQKDEQIKIVQEQLHILRAELDESEQRQGEYENYLKELHQLKTKLKKLQPSYQQTDIQIYSKGKCSLQQTQISSIKTKKTKIYYLHKSLKTKTQFLRNQLIQVKQKNKQELQSFRNYITSMIKFLLQKSNEQKIICSYCEHKSTFQKNLKIKNKQLQEQKASKQMEKTTKFKNQYNFLHNNYQGQEILQNNQKSVTATKWSKHIRNLNQKFKTIDSQNKEYKIHLQNILNEHK